MGRPPIDLDKGRKTNAEYQARHRARHGRGPDRTNAARQARFRTKHRGAVVAVEAGTIVPQPVARVMSPAEPLLASAVAVLEREGETDMVRRLRANWPYLTAAQRTHLANAPSSKQFRFWLRED